MSYETIDSELKEDPDVLKAVQSLFGKKKNCPTDFEYVERISKASHAVQEHLEGVVSLDDPKAEEPTFRFASNEGFLAWVKAKPRLDARRDGDLKDMVYLSYATAIAVSNLPDWLYVQCAALEEKSDEECDELKAEYEEHAATCEGAAGAALNLQRALEEGDLEEAANAIADGDFFLDLGFVGAE